MVCGRLKRMTVKRMSDAYSMLTYFNTHAYTLYTISVDSNYVSFHYLSVRVCVLNERLCVSGSENVQ